MFDLIAFDGAGNVQKAGALLEQHFPRCTLSHAYLASHDCQITARDVPVLSWQVMLLVFYFFKTLLALLAILSVY